MVKIRTTTNSIMMNITKTNSIFPADTIPSYTQLKAGSGVGGGVGGVGGGGGGGGDSDDDDDDTEVLYDDCSPFLPTMCRLNAVGGW